MNDPSIWSIMYARSNSRNWTPNYRQSMANNITTWKVISFAWACSVINFATSIIHPICIQCHLDATRQHLWFGQYLRCRTARHTHVCKSLGADVLIQETHSHPTHYFKNVEFRPLVISMFCNMPRNSQTRTKNNRRYEIVSDRQSAVVSTHYWPVIIRFPCITSRTTNCAAHQEAPVSGEWTTTIVTHDCPVVGHLVAPIQPFTVRILRFSCAFYSSASQLEGLFDP